MTTGRLWIGIGAAYGLIAVAMSAVAAHVLPPSNWRAVQLMASASRMNAWHALALLAVGLIAPQTGRLAAWAGAAFALGTLLFCGSVYPLALSGSGPVFLAPLGGSLLLAGWALLAAATVFGWRGLAQG